MSERERERDELNVEAQCSIEKISLLKKIRCYFIM
jgi:hypothetical protein